MNSVENSENRFLLIVVGNAGCHIGERLNNRGSLLLSKDTELVEAVIQALTVVPIDVTVCSLTLLGACRAGA